MPRQYTTLTCSQCGSEFQLRATDVKRGRGQFCSKKCKGKAMCRPIEERFWEKVEKTDDCWLWVGAQTERGYGRLGSQASAYGYVLAHRYSYELHFGSIEEEMEVCHTCDNPQCVRPEHLFLGTHQENMQDMARKGRSGFQLYTERYDGPHWTQTKPERLCRGSQCHTSKLTAEQVLECRRRHSEEGAACADLAREFGVSHAAMSSILQRKSWKHI